MLYYLDKDQWARREHFEFFRAMDEPYWGCTINMDVTKAYHQAKKMGISFYLFYLHKSIKAINNQVEFRYRIEGEDVIIHEQIHAAATVNRPDHTFGFSQIEYYDDLREFCENALLEIERVKKSPNLFSPKNDPNVVHYSSLPWIQFTSISHARDFSEQAGIPKITFGKIHEQDGKKLMPVSYHVHHALIDGFHLGRQIESFQELLDEDN